MTDGSLELHIPPYLNHPGTAINLLPPDLDELDLDQKRKTTVAKILAAQDDHKYLGKHPEVKAIIRLILRQIFIERPKNVPTFIAGFVQRADFPFEVFDLTAETAEDSQMPSSPSDETSTDSDTFEDIFTKMFAGMKNLAQHESMADLRKSYNALVTRSRSRSHTRSHSRSRSVIYQDLLNRSKSGDFHQGRKRSVHIDKMTPIKERHRKSIQIEGSDQERRMSSRRTSMDPQSSKRSSIHQEWPRNSIKDQERRQSIAIPDHERRRSTLGGDRKSSVDHERRRSTLVGDTKSSERRRSTLVGSVRESLQSQTSGEEAKPEKSETGTSEGDEEDHHKDKGEGEESSPESSDVDSLEISYSESESDSDSDVEEFDEDERALLEGQMLFLGMLGKATHGTKPLNLDVEEVTSDEGSEASGAKRAERAMRQAFSSFTEVENQDKTYNADTVSIYAPEVPGTTTHDDDISSEEEEEEFH